MARPAAAGIGAGAAVTVGGIAVVVPAIGVVVRFPELWRYRASIDTSPLSPAEYSTR